MRWVDTSPEALCCVGAHSVIEITREVTVLRGKYKGKHTSEKVYYVCSLPVQAHRADELLNLIRKYWDIEGRLHQSLDVTAREDSSRVRNRNAILVLGIVRRSVMSLFFNWRAHRKNKRQSTLQDYYDSMNAFNNRLAFASLKPSSR